MKDKREKEEKNEEEKEEESEKILSPFQLRNIELLTHLYKCGGVSDSIVELLRQSELDYFSILDKYHVLEKKVNIDEKTNLLKFNSDYLTKIIKTASRIYYGIKTIDYYISFIRFDIDDFSTFNNRYGHDLGDQVLVSIANFLRENSRPTDYVIRFGGEEFDVILPATNLAGAIAYAENVYNKLSNFRIKYQDEILHVTVSAGISGFIYTFTENKHADETEISRSYQHIQAEADNALYEAKFLGKNRYCIYSEAKTEEYAKIRKLYVKQNSV